MVTVQGFAVLDLSGGDGSGSWSGFEDDIGYFQTPEFEGFDQGYTERWDLLGSVTSPSGNYQDATRLTIDLVASLPEGARPDDQMPDPVALTYVFDRDLGTITLERTHLGECAGTWEHTMTVTSRDVVQTGTGPIITLEYNETYYDYCGEDTCEVESEVVEDGDEETGGSSPQSSAPEGPPDLSSVKWLHTDVSGWDDSAVLSSVSVGSDQICLDYDQADAWPIYDLDGTEVVGNPWIFIWEAGAWYAATWEWLRPGQTCKSLHSVAGDHIKQEPFSASSGWVPTSGETYYFMVSGLARGSERNIQQRTRLMPIVWP